MLSLELNDRYRLTVSEMSRKSQLVISTWYNGWISGGGDNLDKLKFVSAISTQVIVNSRLSLYRDGEKLPDGTYTVEDDTTITLPMTEACLNDLPASLAAWLIDAAGRENPLILETFLAVARRVLKNGTKIHERLSDSGRFIKPTRP